MQIPRRCISFLVVGFLLLPNSNPAQFMVNHEVRYSSEAENLFRQGLESYRAGHYDQARKSFSSLIALTPPHQRITAAYLMLGKTFYKAGDYPQAITTSRKLMGHYPQSSYVDDAHYTIASCFYKMGNYPASVRELLWILDFSRSPQLIKKCRDLALKIMDLELSPEDLETLRNEIPGENALAVLTLKLAQKKLALGFKDEAITLALEFTNKHPKNEYIPQFEEFLGKLESKQSTNIKIGVILPFSSEFSEESRGLLRGIRYAQQEFNQSSQPRIELVVRDSEGDIIKAVKAAQDLAQDRDVVAVIGELESSKTAAIAAVANSEHLPLISPVASKGGIASIGPFVFQANCDLTARGRKIARYAVQELGLRTFATLAPADEYGKEMTDGFTSTVDQLGGIIVAQKWYYQETEDLSRQFKSIRELGLARMAQDTLRWMSYRYRLQSKLIEEVDIPVTSIDGLFFPIYSEDIKYIAPQCARFNIRGQFLGGEYWHNLEVLRANQNYVNGVVFVSDYFVDETDPQFKEFQSKFRLEMGTTPGRMELSGYDVMTLLLKVIQQGGITRETLKTKLEQIESFQGLKGQISWRDHNRVNSQIHILNFVNGSINKLR
ncbi:MAG: penicillin-binding protein activator [candidate division KSB1 bacterium]|nr:penicillin-binding protein activator [candidate division KSB1 bacterium]